MSNVHYVDFRKKAGSAAQPVMADLPAADLKALASRQDVPYETRMAAVQEFFRQAAAEAVPARDERLDPLEQRLVKLERIAERLEAFLDRMEHRTAL